MIRILNKIIDALPDCFGEVEYIIIGSFILALTGGF